MTVPRYPWWSLLAGAAVGFVLAAQALASESTEEIRHALRVTGRLSFLLFLVPLTAGPLRTIFDRRWSAWLVRWRGNFGLAFAGNHIAHVSLIVALFLASDVQPVTDLVLVGGSFGLFYLALMTMLTFEAPVRAAGPRVTLWVRRLALYYLTFVFMYDVMLKDPFGTYPALTALWFGAVGLRLAAWLLRGSGEGGRLLRRSERMAP